VIIKAAAGGGGKGMRICPWSAGLREAVEAAQREARNAFGDDSVYLEKYISNPRHIEFQVLADNHGDCIMFLNGSARFSGGTRRSLRRRHRWRYRRNCAPAWEPMP